MKPFALTTPLTGLLFGSWCAVALADGGTVRIFERKDDYQISVFTSPTPLRAGPVDVSVLVQDTSTGKPIEDAQVLVSVTARSRRSETRRANAAHAAATNKLLQAAEFDLPEAGWWDVEVACLLDRKPVQVHFAMEASPPLPRWLTVWPWFTWPVVAVSLFGVHRYMVRRTKSHSLMKSGAV